MEGKATAFDWQAEMGLTKQLGGLKTTEELVELCHIDQGKYVLDVGCGVGVTPCYLAQRYGCRVVGVDIRERMIDRSNERAKREGVEDRVEFRAADAQDLPFEDDLFDAVICESVLAIVPDKQKAANEFVGVTKPGGYVGLNESTWIKTPPPAELVAWVGQDLSGNAQLLSADGWRELLEGVGLSDVVARAYELDIRGETANIIKRYGLGEMLRVWARALSMSIRNPAYRAMIGAAGSAPRNLAEYYGYGVYVGRK
jgi:arsenite methyltransferase